MAARKNKKEPNGKFEAGRRAIRALWTDVTPREWYTILRKLAPNNRWELKGDTITGRCPYHDDHDPSFVINFERRIGKCFGSCGKVVSDLIQLVSFISGKNYSESLTWLTLELHLEKTLGSDADELANLYNVQAMKRALASATREVIFEYLRDRSPHLSYLRPACVYLQYARAIPLSLLRDLPVGVFAKPEHMRKYIPDELHELYDNYVKAYSKPKFWGAIALCISTIPQLPFPASNSGCSHLTRQLTSKNCPPPRMPILIFFVTCTQRTCCLWRTKPEVLSVYTGYTIT